MYPKCRMEYFPICGYCRYYTPLKCNMRKHRNTDNHHRNVEKAKEEGRLVLEDELTAEEVDIIIEENIYKRKK